MNHTLARFFTAPWNLWVKLRSHRLVYSGLTTSVLVTLGKGIAFVIPVFIAWAFGVNHETDAFFLAYGVVLFVVSIFSAAAEVVLVPFITELQGNLGETRRFINGVLVWSSVLLLLMGAIVFAIAWGLLPQLGSLSREQVLLVKRLILELLPLLFLVGWTSVLSGALNASGVFWIPALSPAVRGIVVIAVATATSTSLGIHGLALGYVIAEGCRLALSAEGARRGGLLGLDPPIGIDARTKQFFKTSLYQVAGAASIGFNPVVDRLFASYAGSGALTLLEYARSLFYATVAVTTGGFFTVILTHWSRRLPYEDLDVFKHRVNGTARVVGAGTMGVAGIVWLSRSVIVRVIYANGLTPAELQTVARLLGLFLAGILPFVMSSLYAQAHLAMKNTNVLMQASLLTNVLNLVFNFIFFKAIGLEGLVVSTGLTSLMASLWIYRKFKLVRIVGVFNDRA